MERSNGAEQFGWLEWWRDGERGVRRQTIMFDRRRGGGGRKRRRILRTDVKRAS